MRKIKILYVISTLRACGPVNVLYNMIKFSDMNKFDIFILTLSATNQKDRKDEFEKLGAHVIELKLSRVSMELWGKQKLKKIVSEIYPDIIHTHCFRSSLYMADYVDTYVVCTTIHNYPHKDFLFAYGKIFGKYICWKYIDSIKKFSYLIACSKSISDELKKIYRLNADCIQNGIVPNSIEDLALNKLNLKENLILPRDKKVLISIGRLSKGKNPEFIIRNFLETDLFKEYVLIFLGDGELKEKCEKIKSDSVIFRGNVFNVFEYLRVADLFISVSKSEGMPNAVLEAMGSGVPVLLSDIEPHKEIYQLNNNIGMLFRLDNDNEFKVVLKNIINADCEKMSDACKKTIKEHFLAEEMSKKYQEFYKKVFLKGGV